MGCTVHCFTVAIWDWLEFQVDPKAEKDMDMCDVHRLGILIWASWRVDRALTCSSSAICSKTQLDWVSHSKPQSLSECLFPFKHATIPIFERPNSEKNILTNTGNMTYIFNSSLQLNIPLGNQSNIVKHHESQIDWPHCNAHLGARARLGQNMLPVWQKWSEETMLWTVVSCCETVILHWAAMSHTVRIWKNQSPCSKAINASLQWAWKCYFFCLNGCLVQGNSQKQQLHCFSWTFKHENCRLLKWQWRREWAILLTVPKTAMNVKDKTSWTDPMFSVPKITWHRPCAMAAMHHMWAKRQLNVLPASSHLVACRAVVCVQGLFHCEVLRIAWHYIVILWVI